MLPSDNRYVFNLSDGRALLVQALTLYLAMARVATETNLGSTGLAIVGVQRVTADGLVAVEPAS